MQDKIPVLTSKQSEALHFISYWTNKVPVVHLSSSGSLGKTTVLREFQKTTKAHWLDIQPFVAQVASGHPLAMDDAAWQVLTKAVKNNRCVIIDDLHQFFNYAVGCNGYARNSYFETMMQSVIMTAEQSGCKLLISSDGSLPKAFMNLSWSTSIDDFGPEDYKTLFEQFLNRKTDIQFESVFQVAPNLSCYRIQSICRWFEPRENITSQALLDYIQSQGMTSNVSVSEVQDVGFKEICGVDEVIEALENHIIFPLENLEMSKKFGLTPKRGVMLAGPPGTGKTTIGRALAKRLRGKFFLIDGTVISGTHYFYHHVDQIFQSAIENAPSIVFIDDSDVIFESGKEHGLYRYLLTILDGLESKSTGSVCVMMTAMDLGNIPPALVRSGRIELWLEMKLPDASSRRKLIENRLDQKASLTNDESWVKVLDATEGFSGADIKRLVQDAKLHLALHFVSNQECLPFEDYLVQSAQVIRNSRDAYAKAAEKAMAVNADRPRWFNVHPELFENRS